VFDTIKFRNRIYTPDFRITENNGKQHWLEVKGWMNPTSKTKLARMARYFPNERVDVLDKEQYYELRRDLRNAFE
jgi:predicted nuclease of restriction endonuclease-like RecB superfamily